MKIRRIEKVVYYKVCHKDKAIFVPVFEIAETARVVEVEYPSVTINDIKRNILMANNIVKHFAVTVDEAMDIVRMYREDLNRNKIDSLFVSP